MTTSSEELTRPITPTVDENGNLIFCSTLTAKQQKVRAACEIPPDKVVPIIFVPGIMGSRLRFKDKKEEYAWYPPEGFFNTLATVWDYLFKGPVKRQIELDPENTTEDETGRPCGKNRNVALCYAPHNLKTLDEQAVWRGWGQIHSDSYIHTLDLLEEHCNHMFRRNEKAAKGRPAPKWEQLVLQKQFATGYLPPQEPPQPYFEGLSATTPHDTTGGTPGEALGAQRPFVPIEEQALYQAAGFGYPVHAVGYNWLRSNQEAAERLKTKIDEIIAHYRSLHRECDKVIIVTHSMGGLVTRLAVQLEGVADKVLGVVHGVMPALGAPAAYKRMRAGFESFEQLVLGRNGAECTAIMAFAPGALELLPFSDYYCPEWRGEGGGRQLDETEKASKRHWLRACHKANGQEQSIDLGDPNDVNGSVYLGNDERAWWRLAKEDLINPAGKAEREALRKEAEKKGLQPTEDDEDGESGQSDFDLFVDAMEIAIKTQQKLKPDGSSYHPVTYAFYGADKKQPSWNELCWRLDSSTNDVPDYRLADEEVSDNLNGKVRIRAGGQSLTFKMDGQTGAGDGTVPLASGAAPTEHCQQIFRHAGKAQNQPSYAHAGAYSGNELVSSVTLYSIARIVITEKLGQA